MRTYTPKTSGVYHRYLTDFTGLCCLSDPAEDIPSRSVYLENMWRDYAHEGGAALQTFPGIRALGTLPDTVFGIWEWKSPSGRYLVLHCGTSLYLAPVSFLDGDVSDAPVSVGEGLAAERSVGFAWGDAFYLLDGTHYLCLRAEEGAYTLTEVKNGYIPITYMDGVLYEQRNLLADRAIERFRVADPSAYAAGSPGLTYRVISAEDFTCEVTGCDGGYTDPILCIPAKVTLGPHTYTVKGVGWKAFLDNKTVTKVYISPGVQEVGVAAFYNCPHLTEVYLPDTLVTVGRGAFTACPLQKIYLGRGLQTVGDSAFPSDAVTLLSYHGDAEGFGEVEVGANNPALTDLTPVYSTVAPPCVVRFPLRERVHGIQTVTVEGARLTPGTGDLCYSASEEGGYVVSVNVYIEDGDCLTGKTVDITESISSTTPATEDGRLHFAQGTGYSGSTIYAVARCRLAAVYDGRIFFAGNPELPGTVFYASRTREGKIDPAYVGMYQFFTGGTEAPVTALLPTASYLAVLYGDTVSESAIRYHTGQDTSDPVVPRIYPAVEGVSGRGCTGVALNFLDDPVFLSREGLEAVMKATLNLERTVTHRSSHIDPRLTAHDPVGAMAVEWERYLFLLFPDGEAFLADSRRWCRTSVGNEYEWYRLTGLGAYTGDFAVYRYADAYPIGAPMYQSFGGKIYPLELSACAGNLAYGATYETYPQLYSAILGGVSEEGVAVTYTAEEKDDGIHLYLLCATGERTGGEFSPPTALATVGDRLLIGCENGTLCAVNTDRRGVVPPELAGSVTAEEFAHRWGRDIHPLWYSICGHRFPSGLITATDTCGIPHFYKRTVRRTTVAEMKLPSGGGFHFQVALDRGGYQEVGAPLGLSHGDADFADMDYRMLSFGNGEPVTLSLRDGLGRWGRKQFRIYSDAYASPFGIYRISYAYRMEGKLKTR